MVGEASIPGLTHGLPATLSGAAIKGVLRGQLGFHGLVLTDSLSAAAIQHAGYGIPQAAVRAIAAGADMVTFDAANPPATTAAVITSLVAAVRSGQLPSGPAGQCGAARAAGQGTARLRLIRARWFSAAGTLLAFRQPALLSRAWLSASRHPGRPLVPLVMKGSSPSSAGRHTGARCAPGHRVTWLWRTRPSAVERIRPEDPAQLPVRVKPDRRNPDAVSRRRRCGVRAHVPRRTAGQVAVRLAGPRHPVPAAVRVGRGPPRRSPCMSGSR